jgi:hypothetical protein
MSIIDDLKAASGETSGAPGASAVPAAGAALPPSPAALSDADAKVLSGGGRETRSAGYRPSGREPEPEQDFDLAALQKSIGEDLAGLNTREALDEALAGLGSAAPATAAEEPAAPEFAQPETKAAEKVDAARVEADRKRISQASVSSLKRFLSGGHPTGRRISDDEAFGAEGAVIIGSPDSMPGPSLPF